MSDENLTPIPVVDPPLIKTTGYLGDGEGNLFAIPHPSAPAVIAKVIRVSDGSISDCAPRYEQGRVIFAFPVKPAPNEYLAVVIG